MANTTRAVAGSAVKTIAIDSIAFYPSFTVATKARKGDAFAYYPTTPKENRRDQAKTFPTSNIKSKSLSQNFLPNTRVLNSIPSSPKGVWNNQQQQ